MNSAILLALVALVPFAAPAHAVNDASPHLVKRIALPGVEGQIGHMAIDATGRRLFVTAPDNNTVELIDLAAGKRMKTVKGINEPQDVLYVPDPKAVFVASAHDGACSVLDADSLKQIEVITVGPDAQTLRYDPGRRRVYLGGNHRVYTGNQTDRSVLTVIDAVTRKVVDRIQLESYPASFQLELTGNRIFVNMPRIECVAVIERANYSVVTKWPHQAENYPMALDDVHHRLFVAWWKPTSLHVFDTTTGKELDRVPCKSFTGDIFCDLESQRVYTSSRDGYIEVFAPDEDGKYGRIAQIKTSPGAEASLFVPESKLLYLGVPRHERQNAEIQVYKMGR